MDACAVPSVLAKDERFQALKEAYKEKKWSDDSLAQALQLCREFHGYDDNWFPVEPAQKAVFSRFVNNDIETMKVAKTKSDLAEDSLYNLYSTLYTVFSPEKLEGNISAATTRKRTGHPGTRPSPSVRCGRSTSRASR